MLSLAKLVSGAEDYYLRTVASGREDYYLGAGEAPGHWLGEGARRLGLVGIVEATELHRILAGVDPATGADLTAGRVDAKSRVAGFDLTFSAPKSASVLWALSTPEVASKVRTAHDEAVAEALGYLERHALKTRRGAGGSDLTGARGLVAASFRHRSSRAGDPQLHTHVLVANVAEGADGRWSAPDGRLFYHHARAAGFLYQAALRAGLTERVGVELGSVRNGVAEVKGVPRALSEAFSTRRHEIEQAMARHGAKSARAAEVAALATRKKKDSHPLAEETLRERWQARSLALGHDPCQLSELARGPVRGGPELGPSGFLVADDLVLADLIPELLSPDGLTENVSSFERRDVVRELAARCHAGAHAVEIERAADRLLDSPEVVRLRGDGPGGEGRFSTKELLGIERELVDGVVARARGRSSAVPRDVLERALDEHAQLSFEQRQMVEGIATSGRAVDVVVGKAGAGKTTALGAARSAFEAAGYRVSGAALSARAAKGLEEGAGIPSVTLARLRRHEQSPAHDAPHVLVVDEAGMVGTRDLANLLERAERDGTKVVLVGDPRQLPEIDAGGAFGALATRLGAFTLTENRRQEEAWERANLDELRHGDPARALATYRTHGRIHEAPTMREAQARLVSDWVRERDHFGEARMLAATRRDVEALNVAAREALKARDRLGSVVTDVGDRELCLGDEVVCRKNERRIGLLNGTRGRVVAPGYAGGVTIATREGLRHVPAPYLEAGHLEHGYATTIHLSQGETVDRAFVLATASLYRESGYVALSRARARTDVYSIEGTLEVSRAPDREREPRSDLDRALSTSRAKRLAADDLDAPGPRRREPEGREREINVRDFGLSR